MEDQGLGFRALGVGDLGSRVKRFGGLGFRAWGANLPASLAYSKYVLDMSANAMVEWAPATRAVGSSSAVEPKLHLSHSSRALL